MKYKHSYYEVCYHLKDGPAKVECVGTIVKARRKVRALHNKGHSVICDRIMQTPGCHSTSRVFRNSSHPFDKLRALKKGELNAEH
jgi:hypothetical protein